MDYKLILRKTQSGDFIFLDPPYIEEYDYRFNYNINENLDELFIEELLIELKKFQNIQLLKKGDCIFQESQMIML